MRGVVLTAAFLFASACLAPSTELDPGPLGRSTFAFAAPVPPSPAARPELGRACPAGFRQVPDAGLAPWCDGFPEAGPAVCASGSVHALGEPGCATVGPPCGPGAFAEGLPSSGVRYVRAGAASGGDGSLARPFATVAAALAGAPAGTIVAIGKGTFDGAVRVPAGVTLRGACAAETVLTASAPAPLVGTVTSVGRGAAVEQATLSGERPGAVVGVANTSLALRDVIIDGVVGFGVVAATGATVSLRNVVVRGVRVAAGGAEGRGVYAEGGGVVDGARVTIDGVEGLGVEGLGELSRISLTDVVVRRGAPLPDGTRGNAVEVTLGATVALTRFTLEDNTEQATYVARRGVLRLEDGVVRRTRPRPADLGLGFGLAVLDEGTLEATRVAVVGNGSTSVSAGGRSATLRLTDVVVHDTRPEQRTQGAGFGVVVRSGAVATVQRVAVSRARAAGLSVDAASLEGSDVVVSDVLGQDSDGRGGFGVQCARGATVRLERLEVDGARDGALVAAEAGTVVRVSDVSLRGTRGQRASGEATGLSVQDGAEVTLARGVVERGELLGVGVIAARLDASDLVVRETQGAGGTGPVGRGLHAQGGAQVTGARLVFERNREAGLSAINAGTRVTLTDVAVRSTLVRACVPACADEGGTGVAALGGSAVSLVRFLVDQSARCGLELADEGALDLREGRVVGNLIGACIGAPGYDVERLSELVAYEGNGQKRSADFVPLPRFSAPRVP
ncbi:MAG: hypothetical protein INH41_22215 [Myxococcaceae bacterium]|jgi:hypothetical protein|nr:hypothetical protein [Myxococcaceae bacterium]MCA3015111.1 hypothetical protein [Myxococcaceae bacterium]